MDLTTLRQRALELGFPRLAVARAGRSPNADRYLEWLEQGRHATMDYMARHVARRIDPRETVADAKSVIVVTLPYEDDVAFAPTPGNGKIARYARGRDYHKVMTPRLRQLAQAIESSGPWQAWYSVDTGPVLERDWAAAAGIGWIGRNGLIIDATHGSYFFLGVLVTDREYPADAPATDHCGQCTACVDACPTDALHDHHTVDARRCISYLTIEHRGALESYGEQLHDWVFGCDICQEVCPFNTRTARPRRSIHPDLEPRDLPQELATLTRLDRESFLAAFAGTALTRAGVDSLRRNATLVQRMQEREVPDTP
ncbi:MAG: tRNA epoxyqueuosine(34) reductase QueG [Planctomycetota bacterium]